MCRQIQAKSKIVKMAWHIMACVIESKQICGFCGHKKSRPSQEGADGSCRRCTWSEQASRSFEAWVISRLRTFLMFLCTVCTSIQINHHHDYLFSLFCESMWASVYTYVHIYIYRERESLTRVWHVHSLHIWTHKCANADMWFTYMNDYWMYVGLFGGTWKMSTSPVLLLHAPHVDELTCHIMWRLAWDDFTGSLYRTHRHLQGLYD